MFQGVRAVEFVGQCRYCEAGIVERDTSQFWCDSLFRMFLGRLVCFGFVVFVFRWVEGFFWEVRGEDRVGQVRQTRFQIGLVVRGFRREYSRLNLIFDGLRRRAVFYGRVYECVWRGYSQYLVILKYIERIERWKRGELEITIFQKKIRECLLW